MSTFTKPPTMTFTKPPTITKLPTMPDAAHNARFSSQSSPQNDQQLQILPTPPSVKSTLLQPHSSSTSSSQLINLLPHPQPSQPVLGSLFTLTPPITLKSQHTGITQPAIGVGSVKPTNCCMGHVFTHTPTNCTGASHPPAKHQGQAALLCA